MSRGRVFLLRHAESQHNVDKNTEQLDPALTASGTEAAKRLGSHFPQLESVGVILSSPSQRTIQTALAAFPNILDQCYFDTPSGKGVQGGAILMVDPDAQERSSLPCDTCSDLESLQGMFPFLDFSPLSDKEEVGWRSKTGFYSEEDDAVKTRAARLRQTLESLLRSRQNSSRPNVVVVTHGIFMKALTGDSSIDLPRPGWAAYHIQVDDADGNAILVAAE
jgi:broad specificity phosphatase PhoE